MSDEERRVEPSLQSPPGEALTPYSRPDADILGAAARQDRDLTARLLLDEHAPAIGRLCLALLGSQSEAEDALQETLVAALDGLSSYRGEGTLRAWLHSIARRRCARRHAERSRERDAKVALAEGLPPDAPVSGERLSMARRARVLLDEIRPTEREALVLRYTAELSFREVAEACGIDEAAARKRVSRGLSRLRALLAEEKS